MAPGPAALLLASNSAALAAISVASMVVGYGLLAGLWYFVFSPGAERRAERRRGETEAANPIASGAPAAGPRAPVRAVHDEDGAARLRRRGPIPRR